MGEMQLNDIETDTQGSARGIDELAFHAGKAVVIERLDRVFAPWIGCVGGTEH